MRSAILSRRMCNTTHTQNKYPAAVSLLLLLRNIILPIHPRTTLALDRLATAGAHDAHRITPKSIQLFSARAMRCDAVWCAALVRRAHARSTFVSNVNPRYRCDGGGLCEGSTFALQKKKSICARAHFQPSASHTHTHTHLNVESYVMCTPSQSPLKEHLNQKGYGAHTQRDNSYLNGPGLRTADACAPSRFMCFSRPCPAQHTLQSPFRKNGKKLERKKPVHKNTKSNPITCQ